jgi:hypothetical protein
MTRCDVLSGLHPSSCRVSQRSQFWSHLRSMVQFVSADLSSHLSELADDVCGIPPGLRLVAASGWPRGGHGVTLLMHPERQRHWMTTGPGDQMEAAAGGPGDMRASHADRERVIDTVKAAFARGQLTAGELDARVGQALTARTYAELTAVTLSIPAASDLARPPKPVRAQPQRPQNRLVNPGRLHYHGHHACGRGLGGHRCWRRGGSSRGDVHAEPRRTGHTSVTSVPARSVAWAG